MKTLKEVKQIIEENREELEKKYKIEEIGIFGSYVRNEQTKTSDIDILVTFKKDASLLDLVGAALFLRKKLRMKIDLVSKNALRKELKPKILKEVVML